jgi:hypothetical protein
MASALARTGLPLNDDLVDYILSLSTSLQDLISVVLTSKAFYNVYRLRPHSIIQNMAWNIAGGAMPVALRCIRWTEKDGIKGGEDAEKACLENNSLIANKELKRLRKMAKVVDELERQFARKCVFLASVPRSFRLFIHTLLFFLML